MDTIFYKMNELQLLNNLSKIVVFLLLFFSFFLLTVSSNKRKSNQLFAVFLMLIAFDMTGFFLNDWYQKNPIVDYLRNSTTLLQLPILYFYVRSVCYSNFSLKFKDCIHGLLFLSFFIFFLIFSTSETIFFALQTIGEAQYIGYMVLIFMTLNQYKKNYLQSYTNPENLSYKWLSQMITVLLIAHLFVVTKFLFGFSNDLNLQLLLNVIVSIIALLVSSYFVLKALYQPQLFRGIELKEEPISVFVKKENKELATELTPEIEAKIKTLKTFMTEEEPFLDADLTIQNLALQIGFPPKELSILINHHLGKHFFDFINEYRIQKAKSILENPENKEITVLEILYQVGFNSKSSFNTAFKKHCQITPIEYRKQALSKK